MTISDFSYLWCSTWFAILVIMLMVKNWPRRFRRRRHDDSIGLHSELDTQRAMMIELEERIQSLEKNKEEKPVKSKLFPVPLQLAMDNFYKNLMKFEGIDNLDLRELLDKYQTLSCEIYAMHNSQKTS